MRAVPRADHVIHLEGVTPLIWKSMPCKMVVKLLDKGRNLSCLGLTFVPLEGVSLLL